MLQCTKGIWVQKSNLSASPRLGSALIAATMDSAPDAGLNAADLPETTDAAAAAEPKAVRSLGPLRMVWKAALQYPARIGTALAALTVTALSTVTIPVLFGKLVEHGFSRGSSKAEIEYWFAMLIGVVVVLAIGTAIRFYSVSWLGERVVADIRLAVQTNLLRLSPGFFEENSPKEISSRMTSDTTLIEQVAGTTVSVALRNGITAIAGLVVLLYMAPWLTLGLVIGIPVVIGPIVWFGRRLRTVSPSSQDRVADIGALTAEVLGAVKVVQSFGQEARETQRFAEAVERTFNTARRRIMIRATMTAVVMLLIFGSISLMMRQGAIGVASGAISGGVITTFVGCGVLVASAFGSLTEVYGDLVRGSGAASRLNELLNEKPSISAPAQALELPVPPRGKISFEKVTFRYPTRLEVAALSDFSLTVEPGETVAIVGPSGAGKSTIFQLAERFYDPHSGTIKLDGVPLTKVDPLELRRRMAFVPQEGILFAANARDNLRYGNWDATDEQIWEAARAANAETFLRELPEGLDTFLGENGARLSGGQRQRVAIARALLRDSPILLLDEATSALDAESEQLVQQALDRLMESRTTLVIAHRLATVRKANRILVLDGGKLVESGTHDELSKAGGLYARLASLQFDEQRFASGE